ncbi:hypothetical protein F5X96DRAFT_695285 [Biscogniauxia mediterranea]|nr:hypothetical protein F5X96DRAFT_695285 [Biscogniauxia mediterranea]
MDSNSTSQSQGSDKTTSSRATISGLPMSALSLSSATPASETLRQTRANGRTPLPDSRPKKKDPEPANNGTPSAPAQPVRQAPVYNPNRIQQAREAGRLPPGRVPSLLPPHPLTRVRLFGSNVGQAAEPRNNLAAPSPAPAGPSTPQNAGVAGPSVNLGPPAAGNNLGGNQGPAALGDQAAPRIALPPLLDTPQLRDWIREHPQEVRRLSIGPGPLNPRTLNCPGGHAAALGSLAPQAPPAPPAPPAVGSFAPQAAAPLGRPGPPTRAQIFSYLEGTGLCPEAVEALTNIIAILLRLQELATAPEPAAAAAAAAAAPAPARPATPAPAPEEGPGNAPEVAPTPAMSPASTISTIPTPATGVYLSSPSPPLAPSPVAAPAPAPAPAAQRRRRRRQRRPQPQRARRTPMSMKRALSDERSAIQRGGHMDEKHIGTKCYWGECGQTFAHSEALYEHLEAHRDAVAAADPPGPPYWCHFPGCGRPISRRADVKRHLCRHTTTARKRDPNGGGYA